MRYFLGLAGPEAVLAFGIGEPAPACQAVPFGRPALRVRSCQIGTAIGAIHIPPVAVTADNHLAVAPGALVESGADLHRRKRPMRSGFRPIEVRHWIGCAKAQLGHGVSG
jgi:hypothetical protein